MTVCSLEGHFPPCDDGRKWEPNHQTTFPQDWRRKLGPDLGALGVALLERNLVFFVKRGVTGGASGMGVSKNRGKTPKMDGENDGKPK